MDTVLMPEEITRMSRELRSRILDVIPAATYHMDRFLSVFDLVLSDEVDSAGVRVGPQPVMLLNPDFVDQYCKRDEHLLMLVIHELYHVILGHTRLFPRLTKEHNLVFDAVINSLLCHRFLEPTYLEFFRKLNPGNGFPGRLLRPPVGWPRQPEIPPDASEAEAKVTHILYGAVTGQVTYHEIFDLLRSELGPGASDDCVLIGDHDGSGGSSLSDAAAAGDAVFRSVLADVTSNWPMVAGTGVRGTGKTLFDFLMPRPASPRTQFLVALKRLLERAGLFTADGRGEYRWYRIDCSEESSSVIPNWRDRRAEGWRVLNGESPVIYRCDVVRHHRRWRPRHTAHVYLDVSGSMSGLLRWLSAAFDPLEKRGICRVFAFSTVVDSIKREKLLKQRIRNTYGTDINCVYEHLLGMPTARRPRKAVVVTDGWTGMPRPELAGKAKDLGIQFYVGLIGHSNPDDLAPYARLMERLPAPR